MKQNTNEAEFKMNYSESHDYDCNFLPQELRANFLRGVIMGLIDNATNLEGIIESGESMSDECCTKINLSIQSLRYLAARINFELDRTDRFKDSYLFPTMP